MTRLPLTAITLLLALVLLLPAPARAGDVPVVARSGEWSLTIEELDNSLRWEIYQAQQKLFEVRAQKLRELVTDHLLTQEARKRGITVEQLLQKEVEAKVAVPTEQQVRDFITANAGRLPNGGEGLEERVKEFLTDQSRDEARGALFQQLIAANPVALSLPAPPPPRFQVPGQAKHPRGKADAPITIIEFSDFECPYCRRAQATLKKLDQAYGDRIRWEFRHYPLPFHEQAPKASEAALCAGDQGKFWEYHDALFGNPDKLAPAGLKALAKTLGLNEKKFNKCLDKGTHAAVVQADTATGQELGISGTPTFFVNGVRLVGSQPEGAFRQVIDAELGQPRSAAR